MLESRVAKRVHITGVVQGVGFRPYVFQLASKFQLTGWVSNSSHGVDLVVEGDSSKVQDFLTSLPIHLPPIARIDTLEVFETELSDFSVFEIRESLKETSGFIPIPVDLAVCSDCLKEMHDPADRRYRYPFINCTNCGPRFSIIRDIPYDRPFTTMASFKMCPDCQAEYEDPSNRRFHAQPIACPSCGPQLTLIRDGEQVTGDDAALLAARDMLKAGKILAIKSIGGYQLACDAHNSDSIMAMRNSKHRDQKPFAVMAANLEAAKRYTEIDDIEAQSLISIAAPIVLLNQKPDTPLPPVLNPGLSTLGIMLPYTPLHHLLCEEKDDFPDLLVMTSGNFSDEPISFQDEEALPRLQPLCDAFLTHNRPIATRIDDSVIRIEKSALYPLRRARGYAPNSIPLHHPVPSVLAVGPMMKNTFCLTKDKYAFVSHHLGDLEHFEAYKAFEEAIPYYLKLYDARPEILACDLHPGYPSTRYAQEHAKRHDLTLLPVQHHHAHLAALHAEHDLSADEPILALVFDGTGYGSDGAIWGGELLYGTPHEAERVTHLAYAPLPGGDTAILHPARLALAYLFQTSFACDNRLYPFQTISETERSALRGQLETGINVQQTSSMGRLFDVVSALLGLIDIVSYEGQAAILLEGIACSTTQDTYEMPRQAGKWQWQPLLEQICRDLIRAEPKPLIAAKFHNTIAHISAEASVEAARLYGTKTIGLSGGVFQNHLLLNALINELESIGLNPIWHRQVPTNDGGVSLGQAWVAANYLIKQRKE